MFTPVQVISALGASVVGGVIMDGLVVALVVASVEASVEASVVASVVEGVLTTRLQPFPLQR